MPPPPGLGTKIPTLEEIRARHEAGDVEARKGRIRRGKGASVATEKSTEGHEKQPSQKTKMKSASAPNANAGYRGRLREIFVPPSDSKLGLEVGFSNRYSGALIKAVDPKYCSFADRISVGDRIVTNNGRKVKGGDDLRRTLGGTRLFGIVPAERAGYINGVPASRAGGASSAHTEKTKAKGKSEEVGPLDDSYEGAIEPEALGITEKVASIDAFLQGRLSSLCPNAQPNNATRATRGEKCETTNGANEVENPSMQSSGATARARKNRKSKVEGETCVECGQPLPPNARGGGKQPPPDENRQRIDEFWSRVDEEEASEEWRNAEEEEAQKERELREEKGPLYGKYLRQKQDFQHLKALKINGTDDEAAQIRSDLLAELPAWDKKNGVNTIAKMIGGGPHQVCLVPLRSKKWREKTDDPEKALKRNFRVHNRNNGTFDKYLDGWASYLDGTREDAAGLLLRDLAKRFPSAYAKNFDTALKGHERIHGKAQPALPPGFVSYDGTNSIVWNERYAEAVKFKETHGSLDNPGGMKQWSLGKWLSDQRLRRKEGKMSDRQFELLDSLGMVWDSLKNRAPPGGDPRLNASVAAKLVYPNLTVREVLYLGGFEDAELDEVKQPERAWRTGYSVQKDKMAKKVAIYDTARRAGARLRIEALVEDLMGDSPDRHHRVFGDKAVLLDGFLAAAEERDRTGQAVRPMRRTVGGKKRPRAEEDEVEGVAAKEYQMT